MSPALVQREAALAAVALVAALVTLAASDSSSEVAARPRGQPEPSGTGRWYQAVVGSYGPGRYGRTTACGVKLRRDTIGVAHPVLPCGAKIVVAYGGKRVQAAVVDKGPRVAGHDFDLTAGLASELGLSGQDRIRWRFAGS